MMLRRLSTSTLFPYTTLFRSIVNGVRVGQDPVTRATVPAQAIGAFVPGTGDPANWVVTNADVYAGKYPQGDRKSTRLNSSHVAISYAVFCLKKKTLQLQISPC